MRAAVQSSSWPVERIGDALAALSHACAFEVRACELPPAMPSALAGDPASVGRWVDAAAQALGVEVEPFRPEYPKLEGAVADAGPLLLVIACGASLRILPIVRARGRSATVLGPDGMLRRIAIRELATAVRIACDPHAEGRIDALLERVRIPSDRRARAREAILAEQLAQRRLDAGFSVSLPPSAPFLEQARATRLPSTIGGVVALQFAIQGLSLGAWWVVGKGALDGRLERGWLLAWGLLLATLVPLRAMASFWQGSAALAFSILLKRRLLVGTLALEPSEVRHQGTGQLLGRVIESEAVESLVTNGALASALAVVELLVAAVVLLEGAGLLTTGLLVVWVAALGVASWLYLGRLRGWTNARLAMTESLVERMIGHRTRLAQEPSETWHVAEDAHVSGYANGSVDLDRVSTWITAFIPRAWLVVGLLSMSPALLDRTRSAQALAVGVGAIVLAYRALAKLSSGAVALLGAQVAWGQTASIFRAGSRRDFGGRVALTGGSVQRSRSAPILEARDLAFRYSDRGASVLRDVCLRVMTGDRLLVQGPSGGGKSTLGAILAGIRAPASGFLLLAGLDRHTLGSLAWRRRIVAAPQFHENHVLSATLAFNLLMGRGWPPRAGDLEQAATVCEELGLGPLLGRMPSGLLQMVGETGWQLSHGERSRIFIARALLQNADMIVLDESFAALDPESLERALRCVLARASTLLVIAHP